jgi:hypothetical protein
MFVATCECATVGYIVLVWPFRHDCVSIWPSFCHSCVSSGFDVVITLTEQRNPSKASRPALTNFRSCQVSAKLLPKNPPSRPTAIVHLSYESWDGYINVGST